MVELREDVKALLEQSMEFVKDDEIKTILEDDLKQENDLEEVLKQEKEEEIMAANAHIEQVSDRKKINEHNWTTFLKSQQNEASDEAKSDAALNNQYSQN